MPVVTNFGYSKESSVGVHIDTNVKPVSSGLETLRMGTCNVACFKTSAMCDGDFLKHTSLHCLAITEHALAEV